MRRLVLTLAGLLALIAVFWGALIFGPLHLLAFGHPRRRHHRLSLATVEATTALVVSLLAFIRRGGPDPYPKGWHACENPQCQAPISNVSRASYCSNECRSYAHNRRQAALISEEAPW